MLPRPPRAVLCPLPAEAPAFHWHVWLYKRKDCVHVFAPYRV